MDIKLGTATTESTFTNCIVSTSRQKTTSSHKLLDGSVKIQEAPLMKKLFNITLIKPTSSEITLIETEYDKSVTLNFIFKGTTYTIKFIGDLTKSTGDYSISFTLQEC